MWSWMGEFSWALTLHMARKAFCRKRPGLHLQHHPGPSEPAGCLCVCDALACALWVCPDNWSQPCDLGSQWVGDRNTDVWVLEVMCAYRGSPARDLEHRAGQLPWWTALCRCYHSPHVIRVAYRQEVVRKHADLCPWRKLSLNQVLHYSWLQCLPSRGRVSWPTVTWSVSAAKKPLTNLTGDHWPPFLHLCLKLRSLRRDDFKIALIFPAHKQKKCSKWEVTETLHFHKVTMDPQQSCMYPREILL